MSKKIYYYGQESQYDVLTLLQDKILKEFEKHGYTPTPRFPNEVPNTKTDAFFCFNGSFAELEYDKICNNVFTSYSESFFTSELVGVSFYVDDPVYHISRYVKNRMLPNTIYYTMNKNHNFFVEKFFKVKPKFMAHICTEGNTVPFCKKEYDFFIAGTFEDVDQLIEEFRCTINEDEQSTFEEILNLMCTRDDLHYYDIMEALLSYTESTILQQIATYQCYSGIKKIYRALHRESLITILDSLGYKVIIAGDVKNKKLKDLKNASLVGKLNYDSMLDYTSKSKIILNSTPTYKSGVTERTLDAMRRKTVVLSNESNFLKDNFKDMESVITYNINDITNLKEKIDSVLNNEEKYNSIVNKAYEISENYTIEAFVNMAVRDIESTLKALADKRNVIF